MTGILESIAVGGAAFSAIETWREANEKRRQQKLLVHDLFARYLNADFQQSIRTITFGQSTSGGSSVGGHGSARLLKMAQTSGVDSDVVAAYQFLHQFQQKRRKTFLQDIPFVGTSDKEDTLSMVCEYLKNWLLTLPKPGEWRGGQVGGVVGGGGAAGGTTAGGGQTGVGGTTSPAGGITITTAPQQPSAATDILNHLEFSRQILMRPRLFREASKENLFGTALAHFCDHLERFYDRLMVSERNASSCLDQILANGKDLLENILPVLLFSLGAIVKKGNALPTFDSVTLLSSYRDCGGEGGVGEGSLGRGGAVAGATSSSGSRGDRSRSWEQEEDFDRDRVPPRLGERVVFDRDRLQRAEAERRFVQSSTQFAHSSDGGGATTVHDSNVDWTAHLGRLIIALLRTPHCIELLGGDRARAPNSSGEHRADSGGNTRPAKPSNAGGAPAQPGDSPQARTAAAADPAAADPAADRPVASGVQVLAIQEPASLKEELDFSPERVDLRTASFRTALSYIRRQWDTFLNLEPSGLLLVFQKVDTTRPLRASSNNKRLWVVDRTLCFIGVWEGWSSWGPRENDVGEKSDLGGGMSMFSDWGWPRVSRPIPVGEHRTNCYTRLAAKSVRFMIKSWQIICFQYCFRGAPGFRGAPRPAPAPSVPFPPISTDHYPRGSSRAAKPFSIYSPNWTILSTSSRC